MNDELLDNFDREKKPKWSYLIAFIAILTTIGVSSYFGFLAPVFNIFILLFVIYILIVFISLVLKMLTK